MTCQKCHSVIPRLNEFGAAFMDHGYSLPGATPQHVFPIAGKFNLLYSSAQPDPQGLPKAIVDESSFRRRQAHGPDELLRGAVRRGRRRTGLPAGRWLAYRLTPNDAKVPVYPRRDIRVAAAGRPGVVPRDVRRLRAVSADRWRQPLRFLYAEDRGAGASRQRGPGPERARAGLAGARSAERPPGLWYRCDGIRAADFRTVRLSTYHYEGARPDGPLVDRFWRQGYGVTFGSRKWVSESVWQTGNDSAFERTNAAAMSSGGFTQLRYEIDRRLFALARYEGTNGPTSAGATGGFERDFVGLLGIACRAIRDSRSKTWCSTFRRRRIRSICSIRRATEYVGARLFAALLAALAVASRPVRRTTARRVASTPPTRTRRSPYRTSTCRT